MIMAAFCTALLCANLIGASKVSTVMGQTFGTGILFFPITYLFNDILTEVYGYARSRKVVWAGFISLLFASFMSWFIVTLPPAEGWPHQQAYETVYGQAPRITLASLVAFWCGEFTNSVVLAKLKVFTQGRFLALRTIGSTVVGEAIDSAIFYPLAFWGVWENSLVIQILISNYFIKVMWEVAATPFTYRIVAWLKKKENEDFYDENTNFNPFTLEIS
jgi:uncharacterized integral membrane protein (TIGR00697 family)